MLFSVNDFNGWSSGAVFRSVQEVSTSAALFLLLLLVNHFSSRSR